MIGVTITKTNSLKSVEGSSSAYSPILKSLIKSPIVTINRLNKPRKRDINFYEEFRKKINIVSRIVKTQTASEISQRAKLDSMQRVESLKKLRSSDMQYPKKPTIWSNQGYSCRQSTRQEGYIYENPAKQRRILKKTPISLSSYHFNTNIIPDASSKPLTLQDFQDFQKYLNNKSHL